MTTPAKIMTTPPGRMVQGDAFKPSDKDFQGNPLTVKTGPNAGQPRVEYFVGIALAKGVPENEAFRRDYDQECRKVWPSIFPNPAGPCVMPTFSDKWIDGDGYDTTGKLWSTREGFAGHWVLRASSGYAPKVFAAGHYHDSEQLRDPNLVKLGYYIRLQVSVQSNDNPQKPGMYCNLNLVELAGHGAEIRRGPNAAEAFGAATGALPTGASAAPVVAGPMGAPVLTPASALTLSAAMVAAGQTLETMRAAGWTDDAMVTAGHAVRAPVVAAVIPPAPPTPPPAPPAPPPAPPAAPAAPVPPAPPAAPAAPAPVYHAYAAPPAPPAPIVPAGPIMSAKANGVPYATFIAQGWTDDAMIREGYLIPGNVA